MPDTMTGVLDVGETVTTEKPLRTHKPLEKEKPPRTAKGSKTAPVQKVDQPSEHIPRADLTMIVSLVCVTAFSVCLVAFVVYPVMQTLVSTVTSSWSPAP